MKLFICDYSGTYEGKDNREEELKKFFAKVNDLAEDDQIMFSFLTSNNLGDLKEAMIEFEKHRGDKTIFGSQYGGNAYIDENGEIVSKHCKCKLDYVKEILRKYRQFIDKAYYADDAYINQRIAGAICQSYKLDLVSFMPGGFREEYNCSSKTCLPGLNEAMSIYFEKNKGPKQIG